MPTAPDSAGSPAQSTHLDALDDVSAAVESGAGLPEVARATGRALDASVAVVDASSSVLAVACASPDDERAVLSGESGHASRSSCAWPTRRVGQLRYRAARHPPPAALVRMVGTLIALEVERSRAPERASEAAVGDFIGDLLDRRVTDRDNIARPRTRARRGPDRRRQRDVVRAHPHAAGGGRLARARARCSPSAARARSCAPRWRPPRPRDRRSRRPADRGAGELVILAAGRRRRARRRAPPRSLGASSRAALFGHAFTVATQPAGARPVDLHRAGAEALLAANVAEAQGGTMLAFEDTGAYRLLLPAMSEDPGELQRFHDETVAPLVAYDEQYETELRPTLETFLDADGNVAGTAERLFTHRHTIRYRLERVRELTGLDVGSTDGRERLSLGLKAMRVLGIAPPHGPATEPGAEGGRVPREPSDRP